MDWAVAFHETFAEEFLDLDPAVRSEIAGRLVLLRQFGPRLGRPYADTLKGSRHANVKERLVDAGDGFWRIAYAFDPIRQAIVLVAGDKSGVSSRRFYLQLIGKADAWFDEHLTSVTKKE